MASPRGTERLEPGCAPCPAFLEASGGTLESARRVLSWPQSGIPLSLPPDFPLLSTATHRRNGLHGVKVSCFWGQVVAVYRTCTRPMVPAIKSELGGVLEPHQATGSSALDSSVKWPTGGQWEGPVLHLYRSWVCHLEPEVMPLPVTSTLATVRFCFSLF